LFREQADPKPDTSESGAGIDFNQWRAAFARAREGASEPRDMLRRFGVLGLTARTEAESERRKIVASRLPTDAWPEQRLLIAAVEAETGERHAFERGEGVGLIDAVAASCAVPGLRPLATIGGSHYMDGGVYSIDNADLAAGCDRVVVVTLRARVPPLCVVPLGAAVDALRRGGSEVVVIQPDEASEAAFATVGGNVLDPAVRRAAALAGLEQGRSQATGDMVGDF
ncbi:MAG TPA: patatin-like phospholipase family protein, partial [Thermoanaerobaculia bacterium]|nr:patatin-like phospholipase family protein [Thermoanaerobaculia bacterium]